MEKTEKVKKQYAHSVQQLSKNNRGASLVTVLLVASIVAIFVTAVLAVVILNVNMRRADLEGQDNFYDAESALEEVRAGLATDVSYATSTAYVNTLKNYGNLTDEDSKVKYFNKEFLKALRSSNRSDGQMALVLNNGHYNIEKLQGYLKDTKDNAVVGIAYDETAEDDQQYIDSDDSNYNETKQGAVLKNVRVTYTDPDTKFISKIKTDIVLEYPEVDFNNANSSENVLTYALIANDVFTAKSNVDIVGNAYIGGMATDEKNDIYAANIRGAKNLRFNASNDMDETNVICGGDIMIDDASSISFDGVDIWADSLKINRSDFNMSNSSMYLENDIDMQSEAKATLAGKLVMFGNYAATLQTQMFNTIPFVQSKWAKDNAAYSSSVLLSGVGTKLDFSRLNTMVIGGSAYIDTESNYAATSGNWTNRNLTTGQSLMMTPDQRAYIVPAKVVGANLSKSGGNYVNGLSNPMTSSQFRKLQEEIVEDKGYESTAQIQLCDYVNMGLREETLDTSIYDFYKSCFIPGSVDEINLSNYDKWQSEDVKSGHFTDGDSQSQFYTNLNQYKANHDRYAANHNLTEYQNDYLKYECIRNRPTIAINAYQTTKSSPIVYLFIQFNTYGDPFSGIQGVTYMPAESIYNNWYRKYNESAINYSKLLSNLNYYASGGIKLPSTATTDASKMYFTGNMLATDQVDIIVPDWLTRGLTMELAMQYYAQSAEYQDEYFAMARNLSKRFGSLEDSEKAQENPDLFSNIVQTTVSINGKSYSMNDHGDIAYYTSDAGNTAVVTTKDYTYNSTVIDKNLKPDKQLNVIISAGDVEIDENFEGMIIAGGNVTVNAGCTLKANYVKAAQALLAAYSESDKYDRASNFIKKYIPGVTEPIDDESDEEDDNISMKDFVTFKNWTRE